MPTMTTLMMDGLWRQHGDDQAWVFCAHPTKFGDFFLSMSVFHNFRFRHGDEQDIRLLVPSRGHQAIARMFEHLFTSVHFVPELAQAHVPDMQEWAMSRGRAKFAPGGLVWVHPLFFCFPQFEINPLALRGRASYPELCRLGYRVPLELAAMPPRITETMRTRADDLARQHGIAPGRSLVLCPYAGSYPQDAYAHFTALARIAKQAGYHVVTSVAANERPIPDTAGVFIPFDLLIPFCELAGSVVALRSGVSDILAGARCRKIWVYANQSYIEIGSVIDYELGGNDAEIVFNFSNGSVEDFLTLFDRLHTPPYADLHNAVPPQVQRYLAAHRGETKAEMSLAKPDYVHVFGKYRGVGGIVLGSGWSGLEGWGAWSVGFRAFIYLNNAYADLAQEAGKPLDLVLRLDLRPALHDRHLEQHIRVALGEVECAYAFVGGPHPLVELAVPAAMAREPCFKVVIDILTPHPPSINPADPRSLGVGLFGTRLAAVVVDAAPSSAEATGQPVA